jgi:hypothetical protein
MKTALGIHGKNFNRGTEKGFIKDYICGMTIVSLGNTHNGHGLRLKKGPEIQSVLLSLRTKFFRLIDWLSYFLPNPFVSGTLTAHLQFFR